MISKKRVQIREDQGGGRMKRQGTKRLKEGFTEGVDG